MERDCKNCMALVRDINGVCPHCDADISTGKMPGKPREDKKHFAFFCMVILILTLASYTAIASAYFAFRDDKLTQTQVLKKVFTWYLEDQ